MGGEVVRRLKARNRSAAPLDQRWIPSPRPRGAGCTMPVVMASESPTETEAAATRAPEALRAAIDSPISIRPRSICSPMNGSSWKESPSSAPQVRSSATVHPRV
jgi:hypothetical protein